LAFTVFAYHYLFGNLSVVIFPCGVVDLIFAILFIEFLITMKKEGVSD